MNASRRWAAGLALWVGAAACTVTLVSHYDEQIDRAATELQRRMDLHLTRLETVSGPEAEYAASDEFYLEYLVELRAVELRAGTHPQNSISLQQYELMRRSLEDLRATHETQGTLSPGYLQQTRTLFNQAWQAIIRLEVAKKRNQ